MTSNYSLTFSVSFSLAYLLEAAAFNAAN